jgi:four helix bundle protein
MTEKQNSRQFDLEDRTFDFAKKVRIFAKKLPRTVTHIEDMKQLVRASGSVGANYIEANESLTKKEFIHRIMICRKEAKESGYWLRLLNIDDHSPLRDELTKLIVESTELMKIFGSIIQKSK